MEIIICDVGNAACSFICSPNGYGMMIDCGSSEDKENPIDVINNQIGQGKWISNYKKYNMHPLALLLITHPDDDHVRNASEVLKRMKPNKLQFEQCNRFDDSDTINDDYKLMTSMYNIPSLSNIDWGFDDYKNFQIPITIVKSDSVLKSKERNNNSIVTYIKYNKHKILFCGDLEKEGWEWLCNNNELFKRTIIDGIDILVAPHHGHKSGFPTELFQLTGNVKTVILSKGSEANKDGTDVSSQYSCVANGIVYQNLKDQKFFSGKTLSTRENGNIFINISRNGCLSIYCSTASSNHQLIHNI